MGSPALFWLLYAAIGAMLLLLAFLGRRWRRSTPLWVHTRGVSGTCGHCGYDVRDLPTLICPECGRDLREVGWLRPRDRARRLIDPLVRFGTWTLVVTLLGVFLWNFAEWRYLPVRQTFTSEALWPLLQPLDGGVHIAALVEVTAERTLWSGLTGDSVPHHETPPGRWTSARIGLSATPPDDPAGLRIDPALILRVETDAATGATQLFRERSPTRRLLSSWPDNDPATIEAAIRAGVERLGLQPSAQDAALAELAELFQQQRTRPQRPPASEAWRINLLRPITLQTTHVQWARWAALAWWALVWAAGLPLVLAPRAERWIAPAE